MGVGSVEVGALTTWLSVPTNRNRDIQARRISRGPMNALSRGLEIAFLRVEDVVHKLLRIAVIQRKPGALYLHHDSVTFPEAIIVAVQINHVLVEAQQVTEKW